MYNNKFNICNQNNICDISRQHKQIILYNAACATIKEIIFTFALQLNSHLSQYSVNNQSSHSNSKEMQSLLFFFPFSPPLLVQIHGTTRCDKCLPDFNWPFPI